MAGRINHRGWIVVESIASTDGALCVDFFEHPDGGHGFEHFRTDTEDGGSWTPAGGHGDGRYPTPTEAAEAAGRLIPWLTAERRPRLAWEAWCAHLTGRRIDPPTAQK